MIHLAETDGRPIRVCYWVYATGGHGPRPVLLSRESKQDRLDRENDEHIADVDNRCRSGGDILP